tara:strand:+ start:8709 stop:8933 length:225 start_codon:yes stop_codon:yes gene_type:complete
VELEISIPVLGPSRQKKDGVVERLQEHFLQSHHAATSPVVVRLPIMTHGKERREALVAIAQLGLSLALRMVRDP